MSKTFLIILYSLMVTNFVAMARRGDSDKGGGGTPENFPTAGAAWFLGNHLISYCLEVAPDFGKTKEELAPLIPKAFATWQSYIEKHEVYYDKYLKTEQRFISTRLLPLSDPKSNIFKCNGTEDITFYFGVENERVKKGREMSPELKTVPFFFIRESYNPRTKLGSGFVFFEKQDPNDTHDNGTYPNRTHLVDGDAIIRPSYYSDLMFVPSNWRIPNSIYAALLHEVGHILGCSHLEGTIMSSDIGIWMHHNVLTKAEQKLQFTNITAVRLKIR